MSNLNLLRKKIDLVDKQILNLLSQRMQIVLKIGELKRQKGIVPLDEIRWQVVVDSKLLIARSLGLDVEMVRDIYERIHKASLRLETLLQNK
jgi:chorismate mutase